VTRLVLLLALLTALPAAADACPLAVVLDGDAHAIATVGEMLAARGIALEAIDCEPTRAHLEVRGAQIAIDVVQTDGAHIERIVGDSATAATVIESFARSDVGDPLLASRPVPAPPARAASPEIEVSRTQPPPPSPRGVRLSIVYESSFASDGTRWTGLHIGACIMLGPVCAGALLRGAKVTKDPWDDDIERQTTELFGGLDVPFSIGRWQFAPGFAAGLGHMHTRVGESHTETGGVRADAHVTFSIPIWRRLAVDIFAAGILTQETRIDDQMIGATTVRPDEPRLVFRLGAGLSYGGL
jgi:hypothetical protein